MISDPHHIEIAGSYGQGQQIPVTSRSSQCQSFILSLQGQTLEYLYLTALMISDPHHIEMAGQYGQSQQSQ